MRLELEAAIRDLLYLGKDSSAVANKIADRLKEHSTGRGERRAFVNYLIQSGHLKKAYEVIAHWIPDRERIPWTEFLFILKNSGYKPSKEFFDYFFTAMDQVDKKESVSIFQAWSPLDQRFAELEKKHVEDLKKESDSRVKLLFDKLDYFRAHRIIAEEEKLLKDLILRFPENIELQNALAAFKSRWAHNLISERSRHLTEDHWISDALRPNPDEWDFGNHLLLVMRDLVDKNQSLAYDFAVGLFVMELYQHAVELIREAPSNLATDWFRVEAMLKARRYLECLEDLNEVESRYSEDPETSFAATYIRAQVLYGLGQKGHAIELLRSITQIRPQYRSASSLIAGWEYRR